jgi:hypothetical protein
MEFIQFSHAFGTAKLQIAIQNHKVLFQTISDKGQYVHK